MIIKIISNGIIIKAALSHTDLLGRTEWIKYTANACPFYMGDWLSDLLSGCTAEELRVLMNFLLVLGYVCGKFVYFVGFSMESRAIPLMILGYIQGTYLFNNL